jgi:hypothetical protein
MQLKHRVPNADESTVNGSMYLEFPYREIATRDVSLFSLRTPGAEVTILRDRATCPPLTPWGPTRPRHLRIFSIMNPRRKHPLVLNNDEVSNLDSSGSHATCAHSDRWLPLNWDSQLRDFDGHVAYLANH